MQAIAESIPAVIEDDALEPRTASDEWVEKEFAALMASSGMAVRLGALLAPRPPLATRLLREARSQTPSRGESPASMGDRARTRSPPAAAT